MSDLISRCELFNRLAPVQTLGEAYGIIQGMDTVDAVPVERKSVSGYEGLYEVDNLSRVFSLRTGKQMKQMVDLISRQAAVEAMRRAKDKSELHRMLVQLPPAQPGWIPVTEKPIEGGQYIVTLKDDKEVWTDIAEWNPTFGGRWQAEFFDCEYRDIDNVVAWMPLPTPYREGGQDEQN